jgi:hypothetical protein
LVPALLGYELAIKSKINMFNPPPYSSVMLEAVVTLTQIIYSLLFGKAK